MLAQNESLRPPSPKIMEAMSRAATQVHFYPDPDWAELRSAIGERHQISSRQILCGAGSMELINGLVRAYCDPHNRILTTQYAYGFIKTMAKVTQAPIDVADEVGFTVCVDRLLDAVQGDTRLVFVANPGNPTGTRVSLGEIARLRDGLPESVMLVVDEAYGEFADGQDDPAFGRAFDWVERGNTVVLRTFSKAYGLAGLRIGWGLFPQSVADQVRKLLNPNNTSSVTQAAALAALEDQSYMLETVGLTAAVRRTFSEQMKTLGLFVPESFTNFVLVQFPKEQAAQSAEHHLRELGILVRGVGGYGLADCLRITLGQGDDMQRVYECLKTLGER